MSGRIGQNLVHKNKKNHKSTKIKGTIKTQEQQKEASRKIKLVDKSSEIQQQRIKPKSSKP